MWWIPVLVAMLVLAQANAQPADCAEQMGAGGNSGGADPVLPLAIDLPRRPDVPRRVSGQVYLGVPLAPGGSLECGPALPGPRDILHGPPGDVLHGPQAGNLLRGPGAPVVRMEPVAPVAPAAPAPR